MSRRWKQIGLGLLFEFLIYLGVVVLYFYGVLQFLQGWLEWLFNGNLIAYAFVSLGLIVAQGVFLEIVTSLLVNHFQAGRWE